jgi:hypothetical protein
MKEIIFCLFLTGLFFISFIFTLIIGIVKKNSKFIIISIISIIFAFSVGLFTGYQFVKKSTNKVATFLKPRTGEEIYKALFGKSQSGCVKILNYQDQEIPKIDYAIWLHFKTCPDELNRILTLQQYDSKIISTKGIISSGPSASENWFKPELLGDSILEFYYKKDEYGNGQEIYCNLDSTEVYCKDILD